jgi:hypothetical protein
VRRDELFDSSHSNDSESGDEVMDSEMRTRLNEQIAKSLGLAQIEPSDRQLASRAKPDLSRREDETDDNEADEGEQSADEFEFQLFSNSAPTKVVLEDDTFGDGALVRRRPESYYIVTGISQEQKMRYATAAVTGDQVLERAKGRSWGLELPWRVIHTTSTGRLYSPDKVSSSEGGSKGGKVRPGKKKRVAMRTKARAAEEKAKLASAKMAEKEEHIKDKKKRLNRAKKLRRRAKAREQKGGAGGEGAESGDSDDSA